MSKNYNIIDSKIEELKKEELKLFHSYNRHAVSSVKIEVMQKLITVITKQEALKEIK